MGSSVEVGPSAYTMGIRKAGLDIIAWPFERADLRQGKAIRKDSDMYKALDVLAREVGILSIFSDRPATVTYYASCMRLK